MGPLVFLPRGPNRVVGLKKGGMQLTRHGGEVGIAQVHRGTGKQGQTLVGEWNGRRQGGFAAVGKKAARCRRLAKVVPLPAA